MAGTAKERKKREERRERTGKSKTRDELDQPGHSLSTHFLRSPARPQRFQIKIACFYVFARRSAVKCFCEKNNCYATARVRGLYNESYHHTHCD